MVCTSGAVALLRFQSSSTSAVGVNTQAEHNGKAATSSFYISGLIQHTMHIKRPQFQSFSVKRDINSRVGTTENKIKFRIACSVVCKVLVNVSFMGSFKPNIFLSFVLNILP
jgi:hypothetical protein